MKIYNLTKDDKYTVGFSMPTTIERKIINGFNRLVYPNSTFLFKRFKDVKHEDNLAQILDEVPIYLVRKIQSESNVFCVEENKTISIPSDTSVDVLPDEFNQEKWENVMIRNFENEQNDYLRIYLPTKTISLWGMYLNGEIFIWIDKIEKRCNGLNEFFMALTENVIIHECMHALMDVNLYDIEDNRAWQSKDIVYCTREESLANGFALFAGLDGCNDKIKWFIFKTCASQSAKYHLGNKYYNNPNILSRHMHSWMREKSERLSREEVRLLASWMTAVKNYPVSFDGSTFATDFDGCDSGKVMYPVLTQVPSLPPGFMIGQYAKSKFTHLLIQGMLNSNQMAELMDKVFCSRTFKLSYKVVVDKHDPLYDSNKYYQDYAICGMYKVCSQWARGRAIEHKTGIDNWISANFPGVSIP